jgi:hypothetical protein
MPKRQVSTWHVDEVGKKQVVLKLFKDTSYSVQNTPTPSHLCFPLPRTATPLTANSLSNSHYSITHTMNLLVLLLALSEASIATLGGFDGPGGNPPRGLPGINSKRDSCPSSQASCDGQCIPSGLECCSYGDGTYCDAGEYCMSTMQGCCVVGQICTRVSKSCGDDSEQYCNNINRCIPQGSVCPSSESSSDSSRDSVTETFAPQPTSTSTNGDKVSDGDGSALAPNMAGALLAIFILM